MQQLMAQPQARPLPARHAGSHIPCQLRTGSSRRRDRLVVAASKPSGEGLKVLAVLYEAKDKVTPELLSCTENELGLREWLEDQGHSYVVVSDKDDEGSDFDKELEDAHILISTPFHPAYLTRERLDKAKNLKLSITAGIGSDHVDLHAAADNGLTVAECTGSNNVSTAEQAVLCILSIVRNYPTGYRQIIQGGWDLAEVSGKAFDLADKVVGILGAGRIGQLIMERLKGFGCKEILYFDPKGLDEQREKELGCRKVEFDELLAKSNIVDVMVPLSDSTRGMINKETLAKMPKGSWIVNTARGAICDRQAIVDACESGQLAGYAGDVWDQQPPPKDHPWRTMPGSGMTPHVAGNTIDAQRRYTADTKHMLQCWFEQKPFDESFYIVREGKLAEQYSQK